MLRSAFIGAGHMAERHVDALRRVPTPHQVVGVCDLRPDAALALARRAGTKPYSSVAALLDEACPNIVHICTQPGTHFELARQALLGGAHVYIEKPFAQTRGHADALFELARQRGLLLCAGHQLVRDPAFRKLLEQASALQPVAVVDSYFAFRPPRLNPYRSAPAALGEQLLDILPHPLYTLVSALEQLVPNGGALQLAHVTATPTDLHAVLRIGEATGRLCVSLRARPVASTLTVTGAHGTLTADFVRGTVLGAGNDGTSPLEKIANPFIEGAQLAWRSAGGLTRRLLGGIDYPGLAELLGDFYAAVAAGGHSPLGVDHLRRVTDVYEELTAQVRSGIQPATPKSASIGGAEPGPLAVVTGAAGFLGRALTRELASRGFRVRGTYRSQPPPTDNPHVQEWMRVDLGGEIPSVVFAGATVVVHAAAATSGGFESHARDSVGATGNVLRAMAAAGVRRLVYVSSISVLQPPRWTRERQTERTPLATNSKPLGPYTWGKCAAEQLVADAHARQDVVARIVRPAALIDWEELVDFPGLLGRRLFGHWYLGLGRPGLPFAACEVGQAGAAIAWMAEHFDAAPPIVNLMDPEIRTRRQLIAQFQKRGWRGRVVWVPIRLLAGLVTVMGRAMALAGRGSAQRMSVWSILRPRRYDPSVAAGVLAAARDDAAMPTPTAEQSERATVAAGVS